MTGVPSGINIESSRLNLLNSMFAWYTAIDSHKY
jgi:hypothetical protein